MISVVAIGLFASAVSLRTPPTARFITLPSADIAFASRRDGNWEIYVTDDAGQNQRRLTRRDVEDRFPLWSPDRRQIAFGSLVDGTWELWVMDSDGAKQRRLASHIVAKSTRGWSPDGNRIAFTAVADSNLDIVSVDVASAQVTRLTSAPGEDRDPSWSPDGTQLAFSSSREGAAQVYVMTAVGRDVRRLTNGTSSAKAPRWSPDGKSIVFVSDGDLYVIGADGQHLRGLTVGAHATADPPLWSPDGSRIVFQIAAGDNYEIGILRLSDQVRRMLASSAAYDGSYTWSVDGKRVAFISGRDGFDGMFIVEADAKQAPVRLTGTASLTPAWGSQR
jgi:Tol biopolymer transport system component